MSKKTSIEWTDRTWNPTRGCRRISPGCLHCYAEKTAGRFCGPGLPYEGLVSISRKGTARRGEPRWTGKAAFVEDKLDEPLRWRTPSHIFVNSMSDLFYEGFTDAQIDQVFAVMLLAFWHTFQVLTKREDRMEQYLSAPDLYDRLLVQADALRAQHPKLPWVGISDPARLQVPWIWWGVSVEDEEHAARRIPHLLRTVAAGVRFVSYEPALGPIADWSRWLGRPWCDRCYPGHGEDPLRHRQGCHCRCHLGGLDWVIVGGESGPAARPFDVAWARSTVKQCSEAGVPVFVKQLGSQPRGICNSPRHDECPPMWLDADGVLPAVSGRPAVDLCHSVDEFWGPCSPKFSDDKGGDMTEWPPELQVRQYPTPPARASYERAQSDAAQLAFAGQVGASHGSPRRR